MIVSDFQFYPGQCDRGPRFSFIRCDRGMTPTDHHTLALALGPANRYVHSAYQVSDLDAQAAGGEYLKGHGYQRAWGIGRHILGSQILDYWHDPDGFMVEHFTDGDMFDCTLEPGWAPFTASGLAQWGPPGHQGLLRHESPINTGGTALRTRRAPRRQRVHPDQPARHAEGSQLMTISILRTAEAWWVQTVTGAAKVDTAAITTRDLLSDRAAIDAAAHSRNTL